MVQSSVKDRYLFENNSMSRLTFYMLGIGLLLPWNSIMAAMDFFKKTFPEELGYKPSFTLLVAVSGPMLIGQIFSFFFLHVMSL